MKKRIAKKVRRKLRSGDWLSWKDVTVYAAVRLVGYRHSESGKLLTDEALHFFNWLRLR